MKDKRYSLRPVLLFAFSFSVVFSFAQTLPGKIIRAAVLSASNTILDPVVPTGWTSKTTSGFSGDDIGNAKLGFKAIPTFSTEPFGDLRRGANHLYTDFVPDATGNGVYMYYDGTNLLFRMRLGTVVPGAKGYSILVDTDLKFGSSGANADPNYLPATTGVNGNPGFEREIVLATGGTNNGILVYNIDGNDNPSALTPTATYSGWTNYSQVSIAGSNDNGDPDFFIDFYVPLSVLGVSASTPLRFNATTVMSGQAAIGGPKSDIYGLNDGSYKSTNAEWEAYIAAQPPITPNSLSGTGTSPTSTTACTAAPVITNVTTIGGTFGKGTVTGTWTKLSTSTLTSAAITVYQNGTPLTGTAPATSGSTWTYQVPAGVTLAGSQIITATAQANTENQCLTSNSFTIPNCSNWIGAALVAPIGDAASGNDYQCFVGTNPTTNKGVGGTNRTNTTWTVYVNEAVTNTTKSSVSDQGTTNAFSNNGAATFTASVTPRWLYSNGCQVGSPLADGSYVFWYQDASGCKSDLTLLCKGTAGTVMTPTVSPGTVSATTTSVVVTGAAGSDVSLYYNGEAVASGTIPGTFNNTTTGAITFSNLTFGSGGSVYALAKKIVANTTASSYCMAKSTSQTIVLCTTTSPLITADNNGQIEAGQPITGTSSETGGTTIKVYTSTDAVNPVATVTVAADGSWTTSGVYNAVATTLYNATAKNGSCLVGAASANVTAASSTPNLCGSIATTIDETTTSVTGNLSATPASATTVTLYQDGIFVGSVSTSINSWTISSIVAGTFQPNSQVTIGVRQGTSLEVACPLSVKTVVCATKPASPTYSPANTTIQSGQSVTYTLSGVTAGNFYGIVDANTGNTLSTGIWPTSSGTTTLTTYPFTGTSGTVYNIQIKTASVSASAVCTNLATTNVTVSGTVLPLTFLSVSADKTANGVQVAWNVTNEQNVLYYAVERSTDCNRFYVIGRVDYKIPAGGSNHYSLQDISMPSGRICYRIKQIDVDGRVHYSQVVSVNTVNTVNVQLSPNPAAGNTTVVVFASAEGMASLSLIDANGQAVMRQTSQLQKGSNAINLTGFQKFARGNYVVQVVTPDGISYQRLLLQ